jgi:hypothetical protein
MIPEGYNLIKISNKNGIILKTANKLCTENITLVLDESLFAPTGPVLTLICDSSVLNDSYYYSLDSGSTWNEFTSETMVLENVSNIQFKTGSYGLNNIGGYGYNLYVGTTEGSQDIAYTVTLIKSVDITTNVTWYVSGYYNNGGGSD